MPSLARPMDHELGEDGDEFGRGRSLCGAPPGTSPVRGVNVAERQRTMTGVLKAVASGPPRG
jgi:hypothetical protein